MKNIKNQDRTTVVRKEHIKRGIEKYHGTIDQNLKSILKHAEYLATPYVFEDGRVLLVYDHIDHALLYPSKKYLFQKLQLH